MIAADFETGVRRLHDLVNDASVILPFTGAGISTECGIPDFRSPGGIWTRYQPIPFEQFMASAEMRRKSWRRRFAMDAQFSTAQPGRGHLALASLHRAGKIPAVITQNIDNLHQASGFAADVVVELHGNTTYATCLDCGQRHELSWIRERFEIAGEAPDAGIAAVWSRPRRFRSARAMPEAAMRRAEQLTAACDLFVAIGSSLVVWPAAGFPLMAKRNGARLVILNRDPTDIDDVADLVIRADIGATLAPFIAH
jgi:NAD-dependent deacetylase